MSVELIFLISLFIIWIFLLYHAFLSYRGFFYSLRMEREKEEIDNNPVPVEELPFVSVLIPAHNEEVVIERTLRAICSQDYPVDKFEVICLNDHSTDATGTIAKKLISHYPNLKVVDLPEGEGRSKGAVLNYGAKEIAKGDYIAVYDADNTPSSKALYYLMVNIMKDDSMGAVIGKFRTRNWDHSLLTRFINIETIFFQWVTQAGRASLFKVATIPGTNFVIRKKVLEEVGYWDPEALTEDTELSIRVYEAGYWIKMAPYSMTWEEEPETMKVWMKQRTRWAMGNIYVLFKYFWRIPFMKNFWIAVDILYLMMVYIMFLLAIMGSLYVFVIGSLGLHTLDLEGNFILIWVLAILLFVVEIGIALGAERLENSFPNIALAFLMYFTYTQLWVIVVFRAIGILLFTKVFRVRYRWYKTERVG